jgi:hypothetical protein
MAGSVVRNSNGAFIASSQASFWSRPRNRWRDERRPDRTAASDQARFLTFERITRQRRYRAAVPAWMWGQRCCLEPPSGEPRAPAGPRPPSCSGLSPNLGRYARAGSFREGKQHKCLLPRHKLFTKPIGRAGRLKHLPVHPFIFLKRVDSLAAPWRQPCATTEAGAKKCLF